ncbi:uncharacterized protein LOC123318667 [Coccinella septempunctata]|uniref:uncharacterized protein LOC123318667 n=1 Tax=Coccinella septempunctata TaxID=41139 RepID=UPI001D07C8C4|nr:uncharacterized protein LOC123318667 [Coccinella septempunctata]
MDISKCWTEMSVIIKMPSFCAVVNCGKRGNRDVERFFRIPATLKNRGPHIETLSQQRREAWRKALKRVDFHESAQKYARICSRHFITGEPAHLEDNANPDWVPNQHMGYNTAHPLNVQAVERHTRKANRTKRLKQDDAEAFLRSLETQDAENEQEVEAVEYEEDSSGQGESGVGVQTDMKANDITVLEEQLHFCNSRIYSMESKLSKCELTEESFHNDDSKTLYFTGFPKSEMLFTIFQYICPNLSHKSHLSPFQQLLLTLMKLRLNLPFKYLSYRFSVSSSTCSDTFYKCIDILYEKFRNLVHWPERSQLRKNVPACFKENFGDRVAIIIDCFEIFTETPSNLLNAARFWSNYKHHQTVKFLIGITPQGVISYISEAWVGRTSDKYLTENCGFLSFILLGDIILADRGFLIRNEVEMLGGDLYIPAFTKGINQLHPVDLKNTGNIATVRIHVERVIGLLKRKFKICQGPIRYYAINI